MIIRETVLVGQQLLVQVIQADEHVVAHADVPLFTHVLQLHHLDERLIPFAYLVASGVIYLIARNHGLVHHVDVQVASAQQVLNLPQIEQILGDVFLAFLLGDEHDYPKRLMLRNVGSSTMRMRRPSTVMIRSWAKVERVRMALAVVMFDRLARSSRAM